MCVPMGDHIDRPVTVCGTLAASPVATRPDLVLSKSRLNPESAWSLEVSIRCQRGAILHTPHCESQLTSCHQNLRDLQPHLRGLPLQGTLMPKCPDLFLSAFGLELSASRFRGRLGPYSEGSFEELRAAADIFVTRLHHRPPEEQVLVIPLTESPDSDCEEFEIRRFSIQIAHLVADQLPRVLPNLKLEEERKGFGFFRLKRSDDLVKLACESQKIPRGPLLKRLHKYARTRFKVRREYLPGCKSPIWLAVGFDRRYQVDGTAKDLMSAGADIQGLEVISLERTEGRSSYLGIVQRQSSDVLVVAGEDGALEICPGSCRVEASIRSIDRLIRSELSASAYAGYQRAERARYAHSHCGDGYINHIKNAHDWFVEQGSLEVAPGLNFRVGQLIRPTFGGPNPAAVNLGHIFYCFSPDRRSTDTLPTRGLENFGPFDSRRFDKKEPQIWLIYPEEQSREVERFAGALFEGTAPQKGRFAAGLRRIYGLERIYRQFTPVKAVGRNATAGDYIAAMKADFKSADLAIVVLRDEDTEASDSLYLGVKAYLLGQGIPSQEAKISKITASSANLPYILETMAVAIYAKLGGTPWTVAPSVPMFKELVFGMAYAEFGGRFRARKRYAGIATVFSNDGTYLLTATSPRCKYEEYTERLAETVYRTLRRLADDYGWLPDDLVRVVFHSPKPLTRADTTAVLKAAHAALVESGIKEISSAFLTVRRGHPFTVVDRNADGRAQYVDRIDGRKGRATVGQRFPSRGTVVNLGRSKRLLCVGAANLAIREDSGIPRPLQIELHRDSSFTDMAALVRQVYEFTGLSWKSTKPGTAPVTIAYSRMIAEMMTRLDEVPGWSDELLDTRLRRSRWFL